MSYRACATHLHLHTSKESGGCIAGHMANARKLGMRYIWFTDHDYRLSIRENAAHGFPFTGPDMTVDHAGYPCGFAASGDGDASMVPSDGGYALRLTPAAAGDGRPGSVRAEFVSGKNAVKSLHVLSLQHGVTLETRWKLDGFDPAVHRLIVEITLSKRPPDGLPARMLYVLGRTDGLGGPHTQILPLPADFGGERRFEPSLDVSADPEIGGRDNAFAGFSVTLETCGRPFSASLSRFDIVTARSDEDVRQAQIALAGEMYERYGVTAFFGNEVSRVSHRNCFSTDVPVYSYPDGWTLPDVLAYLQDHGAVYAHNHPLSGMTPGDETRLLAAARALLDSRAWGASLIEVGYPMGRGGSLADYLRLWDILTAHGLFLTGYGSSDSHDITKNWFDGNNFCGFFLVDADLPDPVPESAFLDAMRAGRAYTGDPARLSCEVSFASADGTLPMGAAKRALADESLPLRFSMAGTGAGWRFRCVMNGRVAGEQVLSGGKYVYETILTADRPVSFARCELYDETGRCILLTNPIHLVTDDALPVPAVREYTAK